MLCLGKIIKDWSVDNMEKTGLNGYVYDFKVDYRTVPIILISNIHRYLMVKKKICLKMRQYKIFGLLKGVSYKISIYIDFSKRKFVELSFNEQLRM